MKHYQNFIIQDSIYMNALITPSPLDTNLTHHGRLISSVNGDTFTYFSNGGNVKDLGQTPSSISSGIVPLPALPMHQSSAEQISNNPYPIRNALIAEPVYPKLIVDKPIPNSINPIAITSS